MEILLDSTIRDWVLIPLFIVVFLAGMLRIILSHLMDSKQDQDKNDTYVQEVILRSEKLKKNRKILSETSFKNRRAYFCKANVGILHKEFENNSMPMFMDPSSQLGMIKKNAAYGITTMLLLNWVSSFCSGCILAKIPFPLTQKFRSMLQRGVELSALDVTYVSSSSLYFLMMFSMNGILGLTMGDINKDKFENMEMAMAMPMMQGPTKDLTKIFKTERESLEMVSHKFGLNGIEEYFLKL
jgi:ER membrane protein complex subunit 3